MNNLLRAILRRGVAFAVVFVVGVTVVMLRVYYLKDEKLGSDRLDASSIREEFLLRWHTPYSLKVTIPPEGDLTDDSLLRRPHPLLLIVSVDEERRVYLNHEENGTLEDTRVLRDRLSGLFVEREVTGAYLTGMDPRTGLQRSRKTEKTVRVDVPYTLKYGEVVDLIDAIKAAGADPVELQIDGRINQEKFSITIPQSTSNR